MSHLSPRQWTRLIWHTRPGHRPAGIVHDRRHAYCLACGARLT